MQKALPDSSGMTSGSEYTNCSSRTASHCKIVRSSPPSCHRLLEQYVRADLEPTAMALCALCRAAASSPSHSPCCFAQHQRLCETRYQRDIADSLLAEKEKLEKEIGGELALELPQEGGTTATVAVVHRRGLLVAWVGDSRAVLGVQGESKMEAVALTVDHNLDDEAERKRLLRAGGKSDQELLRKHVSVPGVEGSLKVTRSLGDSPFHKDDVVSCIPGVRHFALSPVTRFLVIASDGIWDHLTNDKVVDVVHESLQRRAQTRSQDVSAGPAADACEAVLGNALQSQLFSRPDHL